LIAENESPVFKLSTSNDLEDYDKIQYLLEMFD